MNIRSIQSHQSKHTHHGNGRQLIASASAGRSSVVLHNWEGGGGLSGFCLGLSNNQPFISYPFVK